MLRFLFSITAILFLFAGCNRPEPNPELRDGIYADLNMQLAEATRASAGETKKLEEHGKALSEVVPQTGQIKFARKRVFDSQARIAKIKQEIQWIKLRMEERKEQSAKKYLKAFKNNEIWPDPAELEQYNAEKKLRSAKRTWDVRKRLEEAGLGKIKPKESSKKSDGAPEKEGH